MAVEHDFCVVATSLHRQSRSQGHGIPVPNRAATAPFPELRRSPRPSCPPLLQRRVQSHHGKPAPSSSPKSRSAPCAGQLIVTSTKATKTSPYFSSSSMHGSNNTPVTKAATKASSAEGDSENPCCEPMGIIPGTDTERAGGLRGRTRITLAGMTRNLGDGDRATATSTMEQLPICTKKRSGLEAVSGDVLVQICDYIHDRDIVRLSTGSPAAFDERLWQQLHLVRYGPPNNGCLERLPFGWASRLQLQSNFPIHHARLFAIQHYHGRIRSTISPDGSCCPRLMFAAEALVHEDQLLREKEAASRLDRADVRQKRHTTRTSLMRELAVSKRISTEERMAMVDVRSAVERHAYAPGCRPEAPQIPSTWRDNGVRGRGRAKGASQASCSSLIGVFDGA